MGNDEFDEEYNGEFDQEQKFDQGKLRYDLVPPEVIRALASVMTYGATKYEEGSWLAVEPFYKRYMAALLRHLQAFRLGEEIDPESGLPHLHHALTNLAFLVAKIDIDDEDNAIVFGDMIKLEKQHNEGSFKSRIRQMASIIR